jgi:tRNA modification GTPase
MLATDSDPIVAIATAPGRGGIGVVRVSFGRAGEPAARLLMQVIVGQTLAARHASYVPFLDAGGNALDRGIALYFPAPHSYTGEHVLELQGHGGPIVLQLVLQRCIDAGREFSLRLAEPGEFTRRAFLNDKLDLAQAEAVADLIDASTEAAARSAARALEGAFSHEVQLLRDALIQLRMLVEATLDFPEEEIDFLRSSDARGQLQRLQQRLAQVMQRTQQGALLREGIKVVIAGQPNAGKSSLLNALAGAELAIVTPIAGTTRDRVQQTIQIEGVPLHVIDTAGLRESSDEVERIGIARAWEAISTADAVLFLHDLTRADEPSYRAADAAIENALAQCLPARVPLIDVWNKSDCMPLQHPAQAAHDRPAIALSARTGQGLDALRRALLQVAGWQAAPRGVYIARARHVQALQAVQSHLQQASALLEAPDLPLDLLAEELRLAQNALNTITGEFSSDNLLGVIFSRFCIGK